jgi:DNA repair protein RadC
MNESKTSTKMINAPIRIEGAVYEVTLRYKKISEDGGKITSSGDAYRILKSAQIDCDIERKEYFHCIFLKRNNEVLAVSKISEGGCT